MIAVSMMSATLLLLKMLKTIAMCSVAVDVSIMMVSAAARIAVRCAPFAVVCGAQGKG
jgi:hypothetical protein